MTSSIRSCSTIHTLRAGPFLSRCDFRRIRTFGRRSTIGCRRRAFILLRVDVGVGHSHGVRECDGRRLRIRRIASSIGVGSRCESWIYFGGRRGGPEPIGGRRNLRGRRARKWRTATHVDRVEDSLPERLDVLVSVLQYGDLRVDYFLILRKKRPLIGWIR